MTYETQEEDIVHWECAACGELITNSIHDEDGISIGYNLHYDLERNAKELYLDKEEIVDEPSERNLKFSRRICSDCIDQALNESETLRKIFCSNKHDARF